MAASKYWALDKPIMNKFAYVAVLVLIILQPLSVSAKEQAFDATVLQQLTTSYSGQRWLMVLWSIDCPPCFKELEIIGKLAQKNLALPVVIINADGDESLAIERNNVLKQFGLQTIDTYYFTDSNVETSRYQIDPKWHGELPRSYFVDVQGKRFGKSGLLSKTLILDWITKE